MKQNHLSHAEELRLISIVQSKSLRAEAAQVQLLQANRYFIKGLCKTPNRDRFTQEDLYQEACIAFLKAIDSFDLSSGNTLRTHSYYLIKAALKEFRALLSPRYIQVSPSIENPYAKDFGQRTYYIEEYEGGYDSPFLSSKLSQSEDDLFGSDFSTTISTYARDVYNRLTEKQQAVVYLRYESNMSQTEIASFMSVTKERVTAILNTFHVNLQKAISGELEYNDAPVDIRFPKPFNLTKH